MKYNIPPEELISQRKEIGKKLMNCRINKGMDRPELADKMGIHVSTISKIEAGKWNFGIDLISIYAFHLGFSFETSIQKHEMIIEVLNVSEDDLAEIADHFLCSCSKVSKSRLDHRFKIMSVDPINFFWLGMNLVEKLRSIKSEEHFTPITSSLNSHVGHDLTGK